MLLETYRSKGINAYFVVMRGIKPDGQEAMDFGKPATEQDKAKAYKGKSHQVEVNLQNKLDGWYLYKEANGHRTKYGYVKIQQGECIEECSTVEEFYLTRVNEVCPNLKPLEGTQKQIVWAEQIRAQVIISLGYEAIDNWSLHPELIDKLNAQEWIEWHGGKPESIAQNYLLEHRMY